MAAQTWTFTQRNASPGKLPKTIRLEGANCPFGRPRQKEVVADGSELRQAITRYPGNNVPTRHIFGTKYNEWQLNGRWRDANLGQNGASDLAKQFHDLLDDARPLIVSWGEIVSVDAWLTKFTPKRESPNEISWEMTLDIDLPQNKTVQVIRNPVRAATLADEIVIELAGIERQMTEVKRNSGVKTDFLEFLDNIVSSINTFSGSIVNAVRELDVLVSGTGQELNRLRAGIHQMKTAVLELRDTMSTAKDDTIRTVQYADDDINWFTVYILTDIGATRMLALLADLDRETEIQLRSVENDSYIAKDGDSWESIAIRFYGDPNDGQLIRNANGIKYGEVPRAGRTYTIPKI